MRQKLIICCLTFMFFSVALVLNASDLKVSDIKLSATNWGQQTATINLSNSGENFTFVVAISEVRFTGSQYESPRYSRKSFFIEPSSENELMLPVIIPAGYGKVEIDISLYSVVDTLDQIFGSQLFFTKSFPMEFKISEKLKDEIVDEIRLPKFIENNILFDNYFSRALLTLIYNEKTIDEIADLCLTDVDFIRTRMDEYQEAGLIKSDGSRAVLNFITINENQAEEIIPAIDKTVDNLFEIISKNYNNYDNAIADLVSEGKLSKDKSDALDPGTILYQKYPVTLGLFLWDILGREFVNDGKPFNIFEVSGPCNAVMGDYMYMMVGAEKYIGDSYYYATGDPANDVIYCGFGQHNFNCPRHYHESSKKKRRIRFEFDSKNPDKIYLFNEDNVRKPLSILMDGTIEMAENLKTELDNIFAGTFYDTNNKGARYWCWDLVVTRLMKKLVDEKILEEDNIRLYRLQRVNF